jgi:hypothetical protein
MSEGKQYFLLAVIPTSYLAVMHSVRLANKLTGWQAVQHSIIPTVKHSIMLAGEPSCILARTMAVLPDCEQAGRTDC